MVNYWERWWARLYQKLKISEIKPGLQCTPIGRIQSRNGGLYLIDQLRDRMPIGIQHNVVASLSEFVGTFFYMLTALGCTAVVNAPSSAEQNGESLAANPAKLQFIALAWGMSIAVNAWVFFRISGGLFNPAVTFAMLLIRATGPIRALLIVAGQMSGSIAASAVIRGLLPNGTAAGTELAAGTSVTQGLFIEMFLTAQVVFAIFMLAAEKHRATYVAPVGIGLAVFICVMMGAYYTGAGLNPARSFGPCVVTGQFPSYHWIYWAGPFLGSCLATAFYLLVRKLEYWTVNPHADAESGLVGAFLSGDDPKRHDKNKGEIHAEKSKGELCAETRRSKNKNHVNGRDDRPEGVVEDAREKQARPLPESPAESSTASTASTTTLPPMSPRAAGGEGMFAANDSDAEEARVSRIPTQVTRTRTNHG
ncbi:aquaporin-like protein [Apiospora rasikravindrae]|uniref:Aquaporin-like protein n=1 Tax=Apiospora rasikravindrae TaxID=990691 RepID=A0ABR1RN90_9PEZI